MDAFVFTAMLRMDGPPYAYDDLANCATAVTFVKNVIDHMVVFLMRVCAHLARA